MALSASILGIVIVPLWKIRKIDVFSVWTFIVYGVFLEIFLRSLYITFDIPNKETIQQVFLRGETKEFLLTPYLLVFFGTLALTLGFMIKSKRTSNYTFKIFKRDEWHIKRFKFIVIALLILSWIGIYLIFHNTVTLAAGLISKHVGVSENLQDYKSYTYSRLLVSFSCLAAFICFVKMRTSVHIKMFDFIMCIVSLGTYALYSFVTQSRCGFAVILLSMAAIYYYTSNRRVPFLRILFGLFIALFIVRHMTYLRAGKSFDEVGLQGFNVSRLVEPVVLNLNGFDISKTGHIINGIPHRLDYQYGETLTRIIFLWIPRRLWPAKPVGVDTTIGWKIFGQDVYGAGAVPPGFIAEMYLNFWVPGVIIGCFILGLVLRGIEESFKNKKNRNCILLYVTGFMTLGSSFMGSGFCNTVVGFLMNFIPMFIILHMITKKPLFRGKSVCNLGESNGV
jgi:oligosaccharide repeat unit polymerase